MRARSLLLVALTWAFVGLAQADDGGPKWAGPASVPSEKFSGLVKFFGPVDHAFLNGTSTARIGFTKLLNEHPYGESGPLAVWLFLTEAPISYGDSFTGWFVATWDAPRTLLPDQSFDNVSVVVPLLAQPPDGIYYVYLGSFEAGKCGVDYCYDDLRSFPVRVRIYQGSYYAYPGPPTGGVETVAVEYFHAGMGHYFVTAQADEIAGLDAGAFAGWARTGESFRVWLSGQSLADVCRFFTVFFAPKSSHFYTANAAECGGLKSSAVWTYEKLAFQVVLPDWSPAGPSCPIGVLLYRLYNDGRTGAPNHRYTTRLALRNELVAQGFTPEDPNIVCVAGGAPP